MKLYNFFFLFNLINVLSYALPSTIIKGSNNSSSMSPQMRDFYNKELFPKKANCKSYGGDTLYYRNYENMKVSDVYCAKSSGDKIYLFSNDAKFICAFNNSSDNTDECYKRIRYHDVVDLNTMDFGTKKITYKGDIAVIFGGSKSIPTSTTSTKVIPTSTSSTKRIPTSTTSTKVIPTNTKGFSYWPDPGLIITGTKRISTSTTSTKVIPTSTTSTKVIPTSTTSTKVIPTSTTSTKVIPTSTTSTKVIPTSTTSTKVIPTSTTSTKVIPTSTTSTKVIPTSTTSTKVIPTSTTSTKTIPTSTTSTKTIPTSTKCLPVTVTVKEKVTVTVKETVTVTINSSKPTEQPQNCAGKWAQCGGIGYSGPTCCQSGSTCRRIDDYYSQCI